MVHTVYAATGWVAPNAQLLHICIHAALQFCADSLLTAHSQYTDQALIGSSRCLLVIRSVLMNKSML